MSKELANMKNSMKERGMIPAEMGGSNYPAAPMMGGTPGGALISAAAEVEAQRAIAEVQASMAIAKRFPRNKMQATEEILRDCCRVSLAEVAIYQYSRGGSDISGPSIRLAEAIAQSWGNIVFGWKEISRSNGVSEIEAYAWDLEKNIKRPIQFTVRHWRDTKKGGYALEDERDIYELCANQASRRIRSCILSIIPGDVVEAAKEQCEATLKDKTQITAESIKKMLEAFSAFDVTQAQIEKRIQRRLDKDIPGPLFLSLRKIYVSLKDGMSQPGDWFEAIEEKKDALASSPAPAAAAEKKEAPTAGATEEKEPVPFEPEAWTEERANAIIAKSNPLKTVINVKRLAPGEYLPIFQKYDGDIRAIVEEIDALPQNPAPAANGKKADF